MKAALIFCNVFCKFRPYDIGHRIPWPLETKQVQQCVLRSFFGMRKQESVREVYSMLDLLRFTQKYKLYSGLLLFKFHNLKYCDQVFRHVNQVHNRPTRASAYDIYINVPRTSEVQHGVIYKCPHYYNYLPVYIKQSLSV